MSNNQKPQDLFLLEGISLVSFNKDFTKVALSKKDNIIYIYSVPNIMKTDTWKLENKLDAHVQYVSGIDWNHNTNEILSCSHGIMIMVTLDGDYLQYRIWEKIIQTSFSP